MPEGKVHWISNNGVNDLYFNVDILFDSVPLLKSGLPLIGNTSAIQYFQLGEVVAIEQISLVLPYQFGAGEVPPISITLGWIDKDAHAANLDEFGINGTFPMPEVNQSFDVGNLIKTPSAATNSWALRCTAIVGWVNMFNTPAALDGDTEAVRCMLKVRHNLDMVA